MKFDIFKYIKGDFVDIDKLKEILLFGFSLGGWEK